MKPLIGITPSIQTDETGYTVHRAHCEAISEAGGLPLVIPYARKESTKLIAEQVDGLYLTGGYDIDPHYFNEEPHPKLGQIDPLRDEFEIELMHQMLALNKPILGICRGSQIINVALGGTMYQDLYSQRNDTFIQHQQNRALHYGSHFVQVEKQSLLYKMTNRERIKVNSNHHQANAKLGKNLRVVAVSEDGVPEAIERTGNPFVFGVQWHPERMLESEDEVSRAIYRYFVQEALRQREQ